MEQEPKIENKEVLAENLRRELKDFREYLERVEDTLKDAKLEEVILSEEKIKKSLEDIHEASIRVARVVDDLVNFP